MVKGPYYDQNGMKRGAWSKEEDDKLRAYVERCGHSNWRQLPKFAGLRRCGKSCRLRWVNYLRPDVKHGNYTQEEDQKIIKLHQQHGNKWSLIAGQFQGRTDNEIKNHWHSHLKKRLECNRESITEPGDMSEEADTTQPSESENPILDGAPSSYNILESSQIQNSSSTFTPRAECDAKYAVCEIFEELSNFWTQPFIPENTYSPYDYAASGIGMDEYLSYFFDNTEFLCQVMQELPRDPSDIQKQW